MTRLWLAVARFAAKRAGNYSVRRYTTDAEWDAYYATSNSTATNVAVTWTQTP